MTSTTGNHADRVFASPLGRRLARERGIDLARLRGSGPRGRVVKRDIELIAAVEPEVKRARTTKTAEAKPEPDRQRLVVSRPSAPAGLSDE
jgi:pyruvate dehydrogenase E2 component (dihydrolipoamide acetyltransferase)